MTAPFTPMLAYDNHGVLPAVDDGWWMEPKVDGVRWQVEKTHDDKILSWIGRNGNEKTGQHPDIDAVLMDSLPSGTVLDGELYVVEGEHRLMLFDVLRLGGEATIGLILQSRRALLEAIPIPREPGSVVKVAPTAKVDEKIHQSFMRLGLEGSVVKRKNGLYHPGKRSRDWLKVKPQTTDEAVVTGFKLGEGANNQERVGALKVRLLENGVETTVGYDCTVPTYFDTPLTGRVMEFAHHGLFPATGKPRHPVFKRWRDDR